jgi:sterol desaturase/sphingolipid hydroxylase (fatty acid hydroxylase superfamily)
MSLYLMLTLAMGVSGLFMVGLTLAFHSQYGKQHRIRDGKHGSTAAKSFVGNAAFNAVFSVSVVYGLTYLLYPLLFVEGPASPLRVIGEGVAMLLLYDFFYYLVHRYPFHAWRILRRVHAVHHVVRNPSALDSLYLHPLECFLGLALLWACAGIVTVTTGAVSIYSFGWAFLVYSTLNVLVHTGLKMRTFPFSIITYLSRRHDRHHENMKAKNYASVTPLWDHLLGTEQS